jgi:hypothetical protein
MREGCRNRQLRLLFEFWPMLIPAMAMVVLIVAPLVQWVRVLLRG